MPTLAFPTADVIERLQASAELKFVGLAVDLQAALNTPPRVDPAVFLIASSSGGPIKFSGSPVQQERISSLTLITWVRNHGTPAAVRAEMDAALAAIDARLAGFSPGNPPFGALRFTASRDEFAHASWLVTQSIYECSWNFSAPIQ